MDWYDLISKIFIGLVTGSIGAYLTAKYALGRYYKEKWWDKRIELYIQLVDCIYILKNAADYWYKHELYHNSQFPAYFSYKTKEENETLSKTFSIELEKLSRIGELSSLFLTKECGEKIHAFIENEENLFLQWEFSNITLTAAHKSRLDNLKVLLDDIINEAKKELKVNRRFIEINITNVNKNKSAPTSDEEKYYYDNY
ncbi:hypothetical protein [Raoultella planticola]|uniref:Uncharacterized protein n=1 Tax=Raoultella planticola TaxID=575 RepID=A0A443VMN6_RAOPL|nr:hypothetical protein [Raoultella planticola]RWT22519.1 hypothetical protein DN603_14180 [Raoultella planticola]VTM93338.1 Uncharacterised protein [Raoultella planticola]